MPSIYITSLLPTSRGKTFVALLLARGLASLGYPTWYAKPVAIVDVNTEPDLLYAWLREGAVFPREHILAREAGLKWRLEEANPFCGVAFPLNVELFFREGVPSALFTYEEDLARRIAAARVYRLDDGGVSLDVLVNRWALSRRVVVGEDKLIKRLVGLAKSVVEPDNLDVFRGLLLGGMVHAFKQALERAKIRSVVQVVEGFSDWLFTGEEFDLVLAVHGHQVAVFDGWKVKKTLEVMAHGQAYERLRGLFRVLSPVSVTAVEPAVPGESLEEALEKNASFVSSVASRLAEVQQKQR